MNSMPAFLLVFIYFFHSADSGTCGRFPTVDLGKAGYPGFRRTYTNYGFGYRVRLPRNVTAYGEPPPQPAHGVGIILSWEPRSYLYLDGSWNAMLFANTPAVADFAEKLVHEGSTAVSRVTRMSVRLGKHKALRIQIFHKCSSGTFVTDQIQLLKRDIVYTLSLTSPKARYQTDKRLLNEIARSFQLIRIRRAGLQS
jgi:hypothetical protein